MTKLPEIPAEAATTFPPDEPWCTALGHFIQVFAGAEAILYKYAAEESKMPPEVFQIVAAGWHAGNITAFLGKVWDVLPLSENAEEMSRVINQFSEINSIRNNLVHYESMGTQDGERISTNASRKSQSKGEHRLKVSPELLSDLEHDLVKIWMHVASVRRRPNEPLSVRKHGDFFLEGAFRYKPNANHPEIRPEPAHKNR